MTPLLLLLVTTFGVTVTSCRGDAVDATRKPGTSGTDVVTAVVDVIKAKCIFSEDRQFLRRLAYVESMDGTDTDTYKQGYNGGIWKVSQAMLDATTPCASVIRATCDTIRREFGIDWTTVTWSDLRKPLYSGLAAVLYLMQRAGSNSTSIPSSIEGQESFWTHYYHFGAPVRNFTSAALATKFECKDNMDLAFILDSSGSIDDGDFTLSLEFVAKVVEAMNLPHVVRVATIIFADQPTEEFYFSTHSTKDEVINAIRSISRTSGGTATDLALDAARTSVFTVAHGARYGDSTKRVAVLVTDGQSNNVIQTELAAQKLRNFGVTVFSIGVGGYDLDELRAVASDPKCTHVYTLSHFNDIDSIVTEIQERTCSALTTLNPNEALVFNRTEPTTIISPTNGSVVVNVSCGIADVYVSPNNPNPNPALYSEKYTATDGHPAFIHSGASNNGQPVYMTVIGTRIEGQENCTYRIHVFVKEEPPFELKCCTSEGCKECTPDQLRTDGRLREIVCNRGPVEFPNPCNLDQIAAGHVIFPYPYDTAKFIRCDYRGDPYVTLCPYRLTFNPASMTCGYQRPGTSTRVPLAPSIANPCTPQHIQAQYLYFVYEPDRRKFIHCDLWGHAWVEQCPEQEIWSQSLLTCVDDRPGAVATTKPPQTLTNPCTPEALAAGHFYFPYPCDHTRFIHCDVTGKYWVQYCPGGMFYDPSTSICVLGDPQHGEHGCD